MVDNIHIMGILNLTPDSFFAGSRTEGGDVLRRFLQMRVDGADIVDLGACSTRPGAPQPSEEEEWRRLEPALHTLRSQGENLSIDTYRSGIVRRAYEIIGPFMVNDISAGQMDPAMLETVVSLGLPYVAMHMKGTPETMQQHTDYGDVVEEVNAYFDAFAARADAAGLKDWILDPGFGFSKTTEQNWELLRRLGEVRTHGHDLLAGLSRKSMIYKKLGITPEEAMPATQVAQFEALRKGARWLRVHDVPEAVQTARLYSTMYTSSPGAEK